MARLQFVFYLVLVAASVFSNDSSKYSGYKVYQVTPTSVEEVRILKQFENDERFDFWSEIRFLNEPVDIMVSPLGQSDFETVMSSADIDYSINVDDVEVNLENQNNSSRASGVTRGSVTFLDFMRHDDINAYLEQLSVDYPEIVSIERIGRSFEGRNLILLKISSGGSNKPIIYVQAAIHAREWIAPPVALYIIKQLVENPDNANLYQDIDWIIIPVVNPDGYEYTHTTERFWRKTRTPGTICYGVDGNRNFEARWGTVGASSWQCDNTYRGHTVFSEVETQAVRNYILSHKDNIKLFLDVHSFGRWLLYPYGYNDEESDDIEELRTLGGLFNDAVYSVRGLNYTVVSFASGLYYASGTSVDWVKDIGIDLAYTIELPAGGTGFDPPSSDIEPVVEETWEGFKAFHDYIQNKFVAN